MYFLIFVSVFIAMEFAAWAAHKYVIHGFMWHFHEDHHTPVKGRWWQKNDLFAIIFAVPSFLLILAGHRLGADFGFAIAGYGIMAYGAAYFFVHEVIIHRRLKFLNLKGRYWDAIILAHRHHHQVRTKEGASNFGMLWAPVKYFSSTKPKANLARKPLES